MADQGVSTAAIGRRVGLRIGVALLAVMGLVVLMLGSRGVVFVAQSLSHAHLHAPDWGQIAAAPLAIQIHLATVATAVVLATVQLLGPKGKTFHRVLGWTLAVLLITTAITALFIRNRDGGFFNPFQVFSVWTLIAIPWAVISARKHNVRRHAALMLGFYFGGMILAGTLAFLPGRLMWRVFFG